MANEFKFTLLVEKNGAPLPNMPRVWRYNEAEDVTDLSIVAAPDNNSSSYHAIAAASMPSMELFWLETSQPLNLKLNLNTPVGLNAGGTILILGANNLTQATPSQNVEYNNPALTGGNDANLDITAAGT